MIHVYINMEYRLWTTEWMLIKWVNDLPQCENIFVNRFTDDWISLWLLFLSVFGFSLFLYVFEVIFFQGDRTGGGSAESGPEEARIRAWVLWLTGKHCQLKQNSQQNSVSNSQLRLNLTSELRLKFTEDLKPKPKAELRLKLKLKLTAELKLKLTTQTQNHSRI